MPNKSGLFVLLLQMNFLDRNVLNHFRIILIQKDLNRTKTFIIDSNHCNDEKK